MAGRIESYALLVDCRSAALVGSDGSIDWLCLPRFDSDAVFASLLGTPDNGRWKLAPVAPITGVRRAYRDRTLTLETELTCEEGSIVIIDFMPVGDDGPLWTSVKLDPKLAQEAIRRIAKVLHAA